RSEARRVINDNKLACLPAVRIQMYADTAGRVLGTDAARDRGTSISALGRVALVAQPAHQLGPRARDALDVPPRPRTFVGKAIARKRWTYDMKRIGRIAAVRSGVRERLDNLVKLHDRTRPSMSDQQRHRVGMW